MARMTAQDVIDVLQGLIADKRIKATTLVCATSDPEGNDVNTLDGFSVQTVGLDGGGASWDAAPTGKRALVVVLMAGY